MSATKGLGCLARLFSGNHDGRAMGVVGTDKVHLVAQHALQAHPGVGLDVLHHVADVKGRVGVGQGGGDKQLATHGSDSRSPPWLTGPFIVPAVIADALLR
jgi:hypothetical protein